MEPALRGGGTVLIPTVVHVYYGGAVLPVGPLTVQAIIDECNRFLRGEHEALSEVVPDFQGLVGELNAELRLITRDPNGNCISGILYHPFDPDQEVPNTIAENFHTRDHLNIHIRPGQSFATYPSPVTDPYYPADDINLGGPHQYLALTLAHEVGHWLGLTHTFGNTNNTGTCGDDGISDTPPTAGSPLNCLLDRSECTPGVIENVQNHMDYSNCRVMFTQGQVERMAAVLADPTLVRYGAVQPENLMATGVLNPSTCAVTAGVHHRSSISCTGTTVSYRALSEGGVVDSVRWTFAGGDITTSSNDHVEVYYATGGSQPVQLVVYGGGTSATTSLLVEVEVPSGNDNGLANVAELPFSEGFENNFQLPTPHLRAEDHGEPGWAPFAGAGHASANCLYVPAGDVTVPDTSDLVIGNFDLSGLVQPAVQFKVATTLQPLTGWSRIQLLFHDQCSNIFVGDVWMVRELYEYASDQGSNFVPTNDGQWVTLQATFPEWNMATGAELVLRLIRPAQPASLTAEAVYIDDLYVGELPVITGLPNAPDLSAPILFPNPALNQVHIQRPSTGTATLQVIDTQGRVLQQAVRTGALLTLPVQELPPGAYMVRLVDEERLHTLRFIKP